MLLYDLKIYIYIYNQDTKSYINQIKKYALYIIGKPLNILPKLRKQILTYIIIIEIRIIFTGSNLQFFISCLR